MQQLTLTRAIDPDALTVRSLIRLKGPDHAIAVVAMWLTEADVLSGGKTPEDTILSLAQMMLGRMAHRSVGSVIMAIRDGMSYTDNDGRIYGQLTWPKLMIWIDRHEELVMGAAASEHSSVVVKNDNLGRDWMDRLEKQQPGRTIDRQAREIERLKKKLESK